MLSFLVRQSLLFVWSEQVNAARVSDQTLQASPTTISVLSDAHQAEDLWCSSFIDIAWVDIAWAMQLT